MRWTLQCPKTDRLFEVELLQESPRGSCFRVNGELLWLREAWKLQAEKWTEREWRASLQDQVFELRHLSALSEGRSQQGEIQSQMPGRVLKLLCKEGQVVDENQSLLIIEAMKMENEIRAPAKMKVHKIYVEGGQSIETGQKLIDLKALK